MSGRPVIYDADGSIATRQKLQGRTWDRPVALSADALPKRESSQELLREIQRAQAIARGDRLNEAGEHYTGDIMGAKEFTDRTTRMVDMGRLVADPVYVKRIEWQQFERSLDGFWLFHQDLVWLFTGKKLDNLGNFFHVHLQTRNYPDMYRVMLPEPILHTTNGGAVDQSFVAIERGEIADLLKRFIVWGGFVRRYTKKQRDEYKAKTGKELLDEYHETKSFTLNIRIVGRPVQLDLFLPSGMDYEMLPVERPGKLVEFVKGPPDPAVVAAGAKIFIGDYYGVTADQKELKK